MNQQYTEQDYWQGRVPDHLFEEYLQRYGYEYTPISSKDNEHSKLATSLQEGGQTKT